MLHCSEKKLRKMSFVSDGHFSEESLNFNFSVASIKSNYGDITYITETWRHNRHNLSPPIIADLFEQRNEQHYNLRNWVQFSLPAIRTVYHGSESISFLGPKIWNMLPDKLKNASSLEVFKASIKSWKPENCPCRLCRLYVQNVGFI